MRRRGKFFVFFEEDLRYRFSNSRRNDLVLGLLMQLRILRSKYSIIMDSTVVLSCKYLLVSCHGVGKDEWNGGSIYRYYIPDLHINK